MSEDTHKRGEEPPAPRDDLEERDAVALEPGEIPPAEAGAPVDDSDSAGLPAHPSDDGSDLSEPGPISEAAGPPEIVEAAPAFAEPVPPVPTGQPEADASLPALDDDADGSARREDGKSDTETSSDAVVQAEHAAPVASTEETDRLPAGIGHAESGLARDDLVAAPDPGLAWEPRDDGADATEEKGSDPPSEDGAIETGSAASPDNLASQPMEAPQAPASDADAVEPEADIEPVGAVPAAETPISDALDDPIWQSQDPATSSDDGAIETPAPPDPIHPADADTTAAHSAEFIEPTAAVSEDLIWSRPEPDETAGPSADATPARPATTAASSLGTSVALWQEADSASREEEATAAPAPAAAATAAVAAGTAEAARLGIAPSSAAAPAEAISIPQTTRRRSVWSYAGQVLRLVSIAVVGYAALVLVLAVLYRWVDPPTSNLMLTQRLLGMEIEHRWVPLRRISPHLIQAVILSEDGAFCRHRGVDWLAVEEAIESSYDGVARGGSTITMQLVKNLFLWSSRSYIRKAIEVPLAYFVELLWPKHRVLEIYLNIVEWGDGVFGADAAARHHFGKAASQLTQQEAALLAVALPNPIERQAGQPGALTRRLAANLMTRMKAVRTSLNCVQTGRFAGR